MVDHQEDQQLAHYRATRGYDWQTCRIPDCGYKVCDWATDFYCAPHSLELLGPDEMTRRYNDTHPDTPWTESFPPGGKRSEQAEQAKEPKP